MVRKPLMSVCLIMALLLPLTFVSPGGCYTQIDRPDSEKTGEQVQDRDGLADFYLGKFEVTQGEWKAIMGSNPSYFQILRDEPERCALCGLRIRLCAGCGEVETSDMWPVENVSWNDVHEFILKLNQRAGKNYRLPTALEWEYAASGGGKKERWAGTDFESDLWKFAWYGDTSGYRTNPVGQKEPNSIGLHDMTGNVREWVHDEFPSDHYKMDFKRQRDKLFPGLPRTVKGGSWYDPPLFTIVSVNEGAHPTTRSNSIGFRVAFTANGTAKEYVDPVTGMKFIFVKGEPPQPKARVEAPAPPPPPPAQPPEPAAVAATLEPVYFDLDKYNIRPDAAEILKKNAEWFKQNPDRKVLIEGNADERASRPYNQVLGKRRAEEVKRYLISLGVDGSLLQAVSNGKDRPICKDAVEDCYWKNRRVDFKPAGF